MKVSSKYLVLMSLTGLVVALDQLTKLYVHASFQLGESVPLIEDILHFTYVRNLGAAFGVFRDMPEFFRKAFFLTMPPVAMVIIASMLRSVENEDRWQVLSLSLIFSGALGNYIDRLRFGFVIDFIDVHYKQVWSYPAFNVADSAIVIGVCLLVLILFLRDRAERRPASS